MNIHDTIRARTWAADLFNSHDVLEARRIARTYLKAGRTGIANARKARRRDRAHAAAQVRQARFNWRVGVYLARWIGPAIMGA